MTVVVVFFPVSRRHTSAPANTNPPVARAVYLWQSLFKRLLCAIKSINSRVNAITDWMMHTIYIGWNVLGAKRQD